ncbi:MAG: hypothetical protein FWD25_10435 [Clostridia bacterium]|nr:hypothetical protein [Clostridia bacterium]
MEQQPQLQPQSEMQPGKHRRKKRRFMRLVRGYLMIVGAGTTVYALARFIVVLLVEAQSWRPLWP